MQVVEPRVEKLMDPSRVSFQIHNHISFMFRFQFQCQGIFIVDPQISFMSRLVNSFRVDDLLLCFASYANKGRSLLIMENTRSECLLMGLKLLDKKISGLNV